MTGKYYAGTLLLRNYNTAKSCVANKFTQKYTNQERYPLALPNFMFLWNIFSAQYFSAYIFSRVIKSYRK